jgi:hypothetical protein
MVMPKKLVDCVRKVRDSGRSESEAWRICQKSTGLKKHKKTKGGQSMFTREQVTSLVAMADQLDAAGLHKEASEIDTLLKEAGIGDWLKGVWQAIKGDPQAHDKYVQIFNGMKKATTDIRKAFSDSEQILKNLERFVTKPDLANLKRWSDLAAQFQDKIEISLKAARSVAQQHQAFEEFSKSIFQSGGEYGEATPAAQPGTPGKPGAGGLTAPDLIEKYKTATPEVKEQIIKLLSGKAPKTPDMEDTQLIEPIKPGEAVQPGGGV